MILLNSIKTTFLRARDLFTRADFLYPTIANAILFFYLTKGMDMNRNGLIQVGLLILIANIIYHLMMNVETDKVLKIAFFSFCSLICISQFFQHAYNFSFVDWLVTFTQLNSQMPMVILGMLAYIVLPIGAGIAISKTLTRFKREEI
ncbi:hypothetical protein AU074_13820 [Pseudomonas sp. ATCC PTA-122608]|nr:hypothetical protein AU074_13820 [Pseudomonas sp. ATCC PTA-122608]